MRNGRKIEDGKGIEESDGKGRWGKRDGKMMGRRALKGKEREALRKGRMIEGGKGREGWERREREGEVNRKLREGTERREGREERKEEREEGKWIWKEKVRKKRICG